MIVNIAKNAEEFTRLLKREIEIMKKLNNEYIVSMHEVVMTKSNLYMFLEFCDGGDLKSYIKRQPQRRIPEPQAILFLKDICQGLYACRENNIIHRDIKPANILIHQGRAKISDFGFARNLGIIFL